MRKMLMTLATLALVAGVAWAQETSGPVTEITGFADAAYFYNTSDVNGEFTVDQVEIDIIHRASKKTFVRADLEWVRVGDAHTAQIEQAFMTYTTGGPALDVTLGKFNAPIGFEALDPVDMYQYSHSLLFDHGGPANLTGASVAKIFDGGFDVVGHVSNGWDADAMTGGNVTWGGRGGYTKDELTGHLSIISGKEEDVVAGNPATRTVFDVDVKYEMEKWLFGGQFNVGDVSEETGAGDVDYSWTGLLLMGHMTINEWLGMTFRYDNLNDKDGWNFGTVGGDGQMRQSFTFCPTFSLDENFGCLFELRIDKSDLDGFTNSDGEPADTETKIAFEATYSW